jgi:hypothetical protein
MLSTPRAGFHGLAQFHCEDLGENPVIQPLLDRSISSARPAGAGTVESGPLDHSLVAQRVQMEPNRRHVQPDLCSELDGIDGAIMIADHLEQSFTTAVAR